MSEVNPDSACNLANVPTVTHDVMGCMVKVYTIDNRKHLDCRHMTAVITDLDDLGAGKAQADKLSKNDGITSMVGEGKIKMYATTRKNETTVRKSFAIPVEHFGEFYDCLMRMANGKRKGANKGYMVIPLENKEAWASFFNTLASADKAVRVGPAKFAQMMPASVYAPNGPSEPIPEGPSTSSDTEAPNKRARTDKGGHVPFSLEQITEAASTVLAANARLAKDADSEPSMYSKSSVFYNLTKPLAGVKEADLVGLVTDVLSRVTSKDFELRADEQADLLETRDFHRERAAYEHVELSVAAERLNMLSRDTPRYTDDIQAFEIMKASVDTAQERRIATTPESQAATREKIRAAMMTLEALQIHAYRCPTGKERIQITTRRYDAETAFWTHLPLIRNIETAEQCMRDILSMNETCRGSTIKLNHAMVYWFEACIQSEDERGRFREMWQAQEYLTAIRARDGAIHDLDCDFNYTMELLEDDESRRNYLHLRGLA